MSGAFEVALDGTPALAKPLRLESSDRVPLSALTVVAPSVFPNAHERPDAYAQQDGL